MIKQDTQYFPLLDAWILNDLHIGKSVSQYKTEAFQGFELSLKFYNLTNYYLIFLEHFRFGLRENLMPPLVIHLWQQHELSALLIHIFFHIISLLQEERLKVG